MTQPIHECVKAHITAAKLSVADIVKATGWSEQQVRRLLNGKTELSAKDMVIFAGLVGKPVAELYPEGSAPTESAA